MRAALGSLRVIALALSSVIGGCSSEADEECIRRYLNEAREKWCFAERTMNGEEYEPLEPVR